MIRFQAWALPTGFVPAPGEATTIDRPPQPALDCLDFAPSRVTELASLLRGARDEVLVHLAVARVVDAVDRVAARLLEPGNPLREEALEGLGPHAGYSAPMACAVLDGMARGWRRDALAGLVEAEFPDPGVLDGFCRNAQGRLQRAQGYPLTFHLGAGSVPGVATTSMVRALLVKSAVLVKPGWGDVVLPVVFARGLAEEDPDLARAVGVVYWPNDVTACTEAALQSADLTVVYGGDDTVGWVRARMPTSASLQVYRHRLGVALVGRDALGPGAAGLAVDAALAVALFDQRGCVSPHVFFVEEGGATTPQAWGRLLADALHEQERALPSGALDPSAALEMQQLRGWGEMEEGRGSGTRVYHGGGAASWTVLVEPGGEPRPSCLGRLVWVRPVGDLEQVPALLAEWRRYLQTVGVAGLGAREGEVIESLARMGVSRVAPLAGVPWPPPWWHHDGSGPLRALVRWTDREAVGEW